MNHAYDRKTWKSGKIGPLAIDAWMEIPPGDYEIRVVLRNLGNDNQGEVTRRFKMAF